MLHVDPDEDPMTFRTVQHPRKRAVGQRGIDLSAECRQLDRDVRVEPFGGDGVEHALVLARRCLSLLRRPDELAQNIDRGHDASVV